MNPETIVEKINSDIKDKIQEATLTRAAAHPGQGRTAST